MTHDILVKRAVRWLRGQGCELVFAEMASCREIPDAIGFKRNKTIVVECKVSKTDFHRDRAKYSQLVGAGGKTCSMKAPAKYRKLFDGSPVERIPNMGTERWYLSEPTVITAGMVQEYHSDHGLLHIHGSKVMKRVVAPQRMPRDRDTHAEVQYLQFAMRHLLGNLASKGVKVNLVQASKMFNREAIDLHAWQKDFLNRVGVSG